MIHITSLAMASHGITSLCSKILVLSPSPTLQPLARTRCSASRLWAHALNRHPRPAHDTPRPPPRLDFTRTGSQGPSAPQPLQGLGPRTATSSCRAVFHPRYTSPDSSPLWQPDLLSFSSTDVTSGGGPGPALHLLCPPATTARLTRLDKAPLQQLTVVSHSNLQWTSFSLLVYVTKLPRRGNLLGVSEYPLTSLNNLGIVPLTLSACAMG